jgi:nicotinamide phosphoribosyltransferase
VDLSAAPKLIDGYKASHRPQYPENTELVFSNWTGRSSRIPGVEHVVFFGLQYYILAYLKRQWDMTFFRRPKEEALSEFSDFMLLAGLDNRTDHLGALHDLGYLPLEIWALPEGEHVPIGVPSFVMWNTKPEFFWLTNYLETQISAAVWGPSTSATIAYQFRQALGSRS